MRSRFLMQLLLRRLFPTFLISLLPFGAGAATPAATDTALATYRAERARLAARPRPVICNNDGNDFQKVTEVSKAVFLAARTTGLENTRVAAISYCTNHSWGLFSHPTKIGSVIRDPIPHSTGFSTDILARYLDAGLDPLAMMVEFGKAHGIEIFWSLRMNDTHDSNPGLYGPGFLAANTLKTAHPEFLLGTPENKPRHAGWTAVNYALPEVRDYTFRFLEEVCQNYDVDGVELDFFRHRAFFKTTANGEKATSGERAAMTGLIRRIRAMTEREGLRRGRPLLVSMRVPDSVAYCRDIGLDIETWLADGLLDLLVVGGYMQLNPWATSVALGHQHGVPVYPSLDESRVKDNDARKLRSSLLAERGRALLAREAGADGIYKFNYFNPRSPAWSELGDPAALATQNKDYFASIRGLGAWTQALPHLPYTTIPTLCPDAPLALEPGAKRSVTFLLGDEPALAGQTIRLRLNFTSVVPSSTRDLVVSVNGTRLARAESGGRWLTFNLTGERGAMLRKGENRVTLTLASSAPEALTWTDLHVQVRYAGSK